MGWLDDAIDAAKEYAPEVVSLASAWAAKEGADKQAEAIQQNNQLALAQYQADQEKYAPLIQGAGTLLRQYGTTTDTFAPFVQRTGQAAGLAQEVGKSYLSGVPQYQAAGVRGVEGLQRLADTSSPADTLARAQSYANPFLEQTYSRGLRDINRQFDDATRADTSVSYGLGDALSGQAAKRRAAIERQRAEAIGDLATQTGTAAYDRGLQQSRLDQQYQTGLARNLAGFGATGLSQATQAQNLASTAGTAGIQAPFQPLSSYGQVVSGTSLNPPQVQATVDPTASALLSGVQVYDHLRKE